MMKVTAKSGYPWSPNLTRQEDALKHRGHLKKKSSGWILHHFEAQQLQHECLSGVANLSEFIGL